MVSVRIETHGCKLNTADSQQLAAEFQRAGFEILEGETSVSPDVYVLNSCTVTHVADKKARQTVASAKRRFPSALTVLTGCYPERAEAEAAALESVDLALGNYGKDALVARVAQRIELDLTPCAEGREVIDTIALMGRTRASVKIQEGCDQVCAYCVVPRVRGRERSVPVGEIVANVQRIEASGCKEVIFTGTQLGNYGFELDESVDLTSMLLQVLKETSLPRIRVSSLQPPEISDQLLQLWSEEGKGRLCPHFHIPLQSGSDRILRKMRRTYTASEFLRKVELVRDAVPDCGVTTDVIAGFPGESPTEHAESMATIRDAEFSDAHVFPFSSRPGTSAIHFGAQIEPEVKAGRASEIRDICDQSSRRFRQELIGSTRAVLWEGSEGSAGLTDNYVRVRKTASAIRFADSNGFGLIEEVLLAGVNSDGTMVATERDSGHNA